MSPKKSTGRPNARRPVYIVNKTNYHHLFADAYLLHGHAVGGFDAEQVDALAVVAQVNGGTVFSRGFHQPLAQHVAHGDAHCAIAAHIEQAVGRVGIDLHVVAFGLFNGIFLAVVLVGHKHAVFEFG